MDSTLILFLIFFQITYTYSVLFPFLLQLNWLRDEIRPLIVMVLDTGNEAFQKASVSTPKNDAQSSGISRFFSRRRRARNDVMSSFVEHHLSINQLQDVYPDSFIYAPDPIRSDGLTSEEARKRLKDGGLNVIDPPKETSLIRSFVSQFHFKFWVLLTGAAMLSVITYFVHLAHGFNEPLNLYCAAILLGVIFFMSALSIHQERKTRIVQQNFKKLLPINAFVIRDCEEKEIDLVEVVVGDIVVIRAGSRIPADVRLLQAHCLKIESSEVTGHRNASEYTAMMAAAHISAFDAKNIALRALIVQKAMDLE
ncbi:unnamed protein product, partial [Mesorhabditis belari]|uniref:Cation-transporting P-type ATPase N-terminal domain-containing protein n=1 Tax=Mesorhabditis belari TaxID=2138241 RepID=A0AAF3EJ76_9BILA